MEMMGRITTDMGVVKDGLQEAKAKAHEAVSAARQTEARLEEVQGSMLTKPVVQEMIADLGPGRIPADQSPSLTLIQDPLVWEYEVHKQI